MSPPRVKRKRAEEPVREIRNDIVEAAASLFSLQGYHATSMQDIAEETGMRKASLYHHVRKKEDLLFAIHDKLIDGLIESTRPIADADLPADEKIRQLIRAVMHLIAYQHEEVKVFLHEVDSLSGEAWEHIVDKRDSYEEMVRGVLRAGIEDGTLVPLDVHLAARGILAMPNWGYTWYRPDGPISADEVADTFSSMVLEGIKKA